MPEHIRIDDPCATADPNKISLRKTDNVFPVLNKFVRIEIFISFGIPQLFFQTAQPFRTFFKFEG